MYCPKCGTQLPDAAKFCYACGATVPGAGGAPAAAAAPAAAPKAPTLAPAGAQALKCPNCGAPIHPTFGDMVLTCEYCGGSVSLGGDGWKQINKHSMLAAKVVQRDDALKIVHDHIEQGFFHRKDFEESTIAAEKLAFVPFWIIPTSATTNYTYQDVAIGVGSTVASIAAAEVLGSALGGGRRRGGFMPFPVVTGPPVNPTRQDAIVGAYEYPVIAVKAMTQYQPKNYAFDLTDRTVFDRKQVPDSAQLLNGDIGEDAAQHAARAYVMQLQSDLAHKKHMMVSGLSCNVEISDGELLHVPVYTYTLERKGTRSVILVDAHGGRVMQVVAQ